MKQMSQAAEIHFKNAGSPRKKKRSGKLVVGLLLVGLVPAVFLYCRYLDRLTHVRVPPKTSATVAAGTAPVTDQSNLAAGSSKPDARPAPIETPAPGFIDSLMSVFLPSAEAVTLRPQMQRARTPVKPAPAPAQAAAPILSSRELPPLTAEQKRLKIAQDGFDDVIYLARRYPESYGFMPDENLKAARLGNPILVHKIVQPGRASYLGQPVTSLLKPADEWVVPIILDNHIRFMVQIRFVGHDYVLGQGSRALAMIYDKILARWPASEGFHPQLVIFPNLPGYYFTIPEMPVQNITDTVRMLEFNPSLSPATVILAGWR